MALERARASLHEAEPPEGQSRTAALFQPPLAGDGEEVRQTNGRLGRDPGSRSAQGYRHPILARAEVAEPGGAAGLCGITISGLLSRPDAERGDALSRRSFERSLRESYR